MVAGKLYLSIVLVFGAIKEQRSTRCHQTVVKQAISNETRNSKVSEFKSSRNGD